MQPAHQRHGIAGRGVWEAPYLVDGHEALIAVDSKGVARKHLKLLPGSSYRLTEAALWELLNRIDPITPPLKLVPDSPAPPPARPPVQVEDRRAYLNRITREGVANIRVFRD